LLFMLLEDDDDLNFIPDLLPLRLLAFIPTFEVVVCRRWEEFNKIAMFFVVGCTCC
jgi:hypothetical protein